MLPVWWGAGVRQYQAKCLVCDEENQIVVLELPQTYEDAGQMERRLGGPTPGVSNLLGSTLAGLHAVCSVDIERRFGPAFRPELPFGLAWLCQEAKESPDINARQLRLMTYVHELPRFSAEFSELLGTWRRDTVINADLKLEHCILTSGRTNDCGTATHIKCYVIDWDLSVVGDRAYDLACLMKEYLLDCISEGNNGERYWRLLHSRSGPFQRVWPVLKGLLGAYGLAARPETGGVRELFLRAIAYVGIWLIQTSYNILSDRMVEEAPEEIFWQRSRALADFGVDLIMSREAVAVSFLGL